MAEAQDSGPDWYGSPEWASLVAAIRTRPDEFPPLLATADFLAARGETERADLIRREVAFEERHPSGSFVCDGSESGWAESRIVEGILGPARQLRLASAWWVASHLPREFGLDTHSVHLRHGVLTRLSCSATAWVLAGDAVLAREPVREVTLECGAVRVYDDSSGLDRRLLPTSAADPLGNYVARLDTPAERGDTVRRLIAYSAGLPAWRIPERWVGSRSVDLMDIPDDPTMSPEQAVCAVLWPGVRFALPDGRDVALTDRYLFPSLTLPAPPGRVPT